MPMIRPACCLLALVIMVSVAPAAAFPSLGNYYRDMEGYEPEDVMDMLSRLTNLLQMERKIDNYQNDITSDKRALDLGLGRGYSGALQAKHLMGLAAANYAGGPGRKRRDVSH